MIAANPHWELPARIITDLESPAHRDAALQQLGQLLEATNERVRRTARAKLVELLDNDSRAVADTARAYLDRPPVRAQPAAAPVSPVRRPTGPTFGAAARAAVRRWRHRVNLLRGPAATVRDATSSWWLVGLLTLAAGLAIWAAALGATPYTIGVAAVLTIAVVVQFRAVDTAFAAGLLPPGVLSAAIVAGDLTMGIHDPLPRALFTAAHAVWLVTAVVGLLRWRPPKPGLRFRYLIPAVVAAALVLIVVVSDYRSPHELGAAPHFTYPVVIGLIAAEFALIGPVLDLGRPFAVGWVIGGFAVWLGLFDVPESWTFSSTVVAALLAIWLLIGVLAVVRPRPGAPIRRLVMLTPLLAPVVLGAVAFAVVPPAPQRPGVLDVALSSDDRTLYAADFTNGRILKFDTTTREQVGDALSVGRTPARFLLAPDGTTIYVANAGSDSVSVIDVAAWKVVGTPIAVAPGPLDLALSPATHRLYVLSPKSETITEIDTATRQTVGGPLASGPSPSDLAVDAKGAWLYVANRDAGTVSVTDTTTRQSARSPITVGSEPSDLALGPDGSLYVIGKASYSVINTNVRSSRPTPVKMPETESSVVVSADGKYLYLRGGSGSKDAIRVVNVGSREVVRTLAADLGGLIKLSVSSDGGRIYASSFYRQGIIVIDGTGPKEIGMIEIGR